jgi:ribosomal protein L37E
MGAILHAITMTYMECPQCGRKALSVATRCPHCGVAFPSQPFRAASGHRLDWLRPVLAVGGVLVLGAVLLAVVVPRLGSKPAAPARMTPSVDTTPALAAPAVRVLNPGDAVQVDSLSRGWYRVLIDGRAAGYVHRSNLDPVSSPR